MKKKSAAKDSKSAKKSAPVKKKADRPTAHAGGAKKSAAADHKKKPASGAPSSSKKPTAHGKASAHSATSGKPTAKPAAQSTKVLKASTPPAKKSEKDPKASKAAPAPTKTSAKPAAAVAAAPVSAKKPVAAVAVEKEAKQPKAERVRKSAEPVIEEYDESLDEEIVSQEVFLTDAEGRRYCRVRECDQLASVDAYCRYHYLLYWKNIQVRKKILTEGKLERYIEELTARYPDKYLEMLRKDLRSEKEFLAAIAELEIDDTSVDNEYEEDAQTYIEEVRGMSGDGGGSAGERDDDF